MHQRIAMAEAFRSAAVEPAGWLPALGLLAAATRSDHAQVVGFGPGYGVEFNWVSDAPAGMHAAFDTPQANAPGASFRVAASLATDGNRIVHEPHYDAVRATLATDDYLDLCSDWGVPFGCQVNLREGIDGVVGLALLRSQQSGRTTPEQHAVFDGMRHDIAAATRLQVALEGQGHHLVAAAFEAMAVACFVLDRGMRMRAMSAPAARLLERGAVRMTDGRVSPMKRGAMFGAMTLDLHRLPAREWSMGFAPFAILIAREALPQRAGTGVLREVYRLTAAETDIAMLLHAGHSRERICAARAITRETLRTHLRAIFAKLDVRRETEAIHRLHAMLG